MLALRADRYVPEMRSSETAISDISNTSQEIKETESAESPEMGNEIQGEKLPETENRVTHQKVYNGEYL